MLVRVCLLVLLGASVSLAGGRGRPRFEAAYVAPLDPNSWTTFTSCFTPSCVVVPLYQTPEGWLAFDFSVVPADPYAANNDTIGYLYSNRSRISATQADCFNVTLAVVTSDPPPTFNFRQTGNEGTTPASARPIIMVSDNFMGEFDRWWSNPTAYTLAAGEATLIIPLTPDRWSSVFGKRGDYDAAALRGFNRAIARINHVGLTFGGGSFFGHGTNVSDGTAQFVLKNIGIASCQ